MRAISAITLLSLMLTGCASGPLRYKTMGNWKYGTVEFTKRAHPVAKPLAVPVGIVTDAGLIAADTLATPFVALPFATKSSKSFMGEDLHGVNRCFWFSVSYPAYMFGLGYGSIDERDLGRDAIWLRGEE